MFTAPGPNAFDFVYETVAGFDLALLYEIIAAEQNEKIEADALELVKQLSAFRNSLKSG